MVKLLIVDHHALVREALERRLSTAVGMEIVGSTGSYEDALRTAIAFTPDVVLLETKARDGLETLRTLSQLLTDSAIIVLTSYPDSREEDEVRELGAARYLLKTLDTRTLISEIRTAARCVTGALPAI